MSKSHNAFAGLKAAALASLVVLGSSALLTAPARADYAGGGGGGEHGDGWNADHDEIYQVQRGDLVCNSRAACGGQAAIPMARPGYFYLPGGMFAQPARGYSKSRIN